jgi:hypothetical protein
MKIWFAPGCQTCLALIYCDSVSWCQRNLGPRVQSALHVVPRCGLSSGLFLCASFVSAFLAFIFARGAVRVDGTDFTIAKTNYRPALVNLLLVEVFLDEVFLGEYTDLAFAVSGMITTQRWHV